MPDEVLEKYKYNQHCLLCTVDLGLRSGSELCFHISPCYHENFVRYRLFFFKKSGCSAKLSNLQIQNNHTILSVAL